MYDASVARDGSVQRSRSVGSAVFLSVEASARHKFRSELRRPSSWPPVPRNHGKAIEDVIALGDARERLIACRPGTCRVEMLAAFLALTYRNAVSSVE
jgi:hypothetical protein